LSFESNSWKKFSNRLKFEYGDSMGGRTSMFYGCFIPQFICPKNAMFGVDLY